MALYVIGDLHLSLGCDKPMDIFDGWQGYVDRLREGWHAVVRGEDTVVLAGDTSWAMKLERCGEDFAFIESLPGKKLLMKGNHDYWWTTRAKMDRYVMESGFSSINFLHNDSYLVNDIAVCGTRGWLAEPNEPCDEKVMAREAGRLSASINHARSNWPGSELVAVLHYPPVYPDTCADELVTLLQNNQVRRCYYGHLHGPSVRRACRGPIGSVEYTLISADALGFCPYKIESSRAAGA